MTTHTAGVLPSQYATHEEYVQALLDHIERAEKAFTDLIDDLARNDDGAHGKRVPVRSDHDVLQGIAGLLEELLAEAKRANSTSREGAVSSCEIKFLASGKPQPVIKTYVGSITPVTEALEAYGLAYRETEARSLNGWQETLDQLVSERKAS